MASSSSPVRELQEELKDAGNSLLMPPSDTHELLSLLDRVEHLLSRVEQAPSRSMQDALLPVMKALIAQELLRHLDVDVKVSVASCFSEITRITAPEAPYDDELMKEIFKLTITALEKLSLASGRCYTKSVSILDTIAQVRSSLVMLDLECDELIVEMFQLFLNTISKIATRYLTPELAGARLTPKLCSRVADAFVSKYGKYAGWAQTLLFIADLPSQKAVLPSSLKIAEGQKPVKQKGGQPSGPIDMDSSQKIRNEEAYEKL